MGGCGGRAGLLGGGREGRGRELWGEEERREGKEAGEVEEGRRGKGREGEEGREGREGGEGGEGEEGLSARRMLCSIPARSVFPVVSSFLVRLATHTTYSTQLHRLVSRLLDAKCPFVTVSKHLSCLNCHLDFVAVVYLSDEDKRTPKAVASLYHCLTRYISTHRLSATTRHNQDDATR